MLSRQIQVNSATHQTAHKSQVILRLPSSSHPSSNHTYLQEYPLLYNPTPLPVRIFISKVCHIYHFLCPLTILGGVSLSWKMPSSWSGRISLECIPGTNVFSSFTHVTTVHWVCISWSVQCLGLKYGVTWFMPDSTLLHGSCMSHSSLYLVSQHHALHQDRHAHNLCTYPTVIFIIQGPLLRAASPQGIPPPSHYPYSSLRRGHIFVGIHASTLVPITYYPRFPDSRPEIASVCPLSVAKIIRCIATQVFSLAMISRGRNSEREEGRRGRRERNKPTEERVLKRIQCLAHRVLSSCFIPASLISLLPLGPLGPLYASMIHSFL